MYSYLHVRSNTGVFENTSVSELPGTKPESLESTSRLRRILELEMNGKLSMDLRTGDQSIDNAICPITIKLGEGRDIMLQVQSAYRDKVFTMKTTHPAISERMAKLFDNGNRRFLEPANESHVRPEVVNAAERVLGHFSDPIYHTGPTATYKLVAAVLMLSRSEDFSLVVQSPDGFEAVSKIIREFFTGATPNLEAIDIEISKVDAKLGAIENSAMDYIEPDEEEDAVEEEEGAAAAVADYQG